MNPKNWFILRFYIAFFLLFLGFSIENSANQIRILPSSQSGDLPNRGKSRGYLDYSTQFPLLTKDILEDSYVANVELHSENTRDSSIQSACVDSRVHFVLKDSYFFPQGSKPSIQSTLWNCKTGTSSEKNSELSGYAIQSIHEHYKSMFRFLPKKETNLPNLQLSKWDIRIFLDASGSLSFEKENFENWFYSREISKKNIDLTYINQNRSFTVNSQANKRSIPWSGMSSTNVILSEFQKFSLSQKNSQNNILQIVLVNPSHMENSLPWIQVLNRARQQERSTILLAPSNSDIQDVNRFRKLAQATQSSLLFSEFRLDVGWESGNLGFLKMNKGYVYSHMGKTEDKIPLESRLNPLSVVRFYNDQRKDKIIQETNPQSNLIKILEDDIAKYLQPQRSNSSKVLVKAHDKAFWIHLNKAESLEVGKRYILETLFFSDMNSSSGVGNFSSATRLHRESYKYPLLREYAFEEIPMILEKYKLTTLKAYLPVQIIEIP